MLKYKTARPTYDMVIYNKNYIVGLCPHFWYRVPKIIGISCEGYKKGLCYSNEVTLESPQVT